MLPRTGGDHSGEIPHVSQTTTTERERMSHSVRHRATSQTGTVRATPKDDLVETSQILGRKWQTVIVHRLLRDGPMGFSDLKEEIDSISSKVLSDNLAELEDAGLVARDLVQTRPLRVEYSLTPAGEGLDSVVTAILDWRDDHRAVLGEDGSQ